MKALYFTLFLFQLLLSSGQNIYTFAGNGSNGFSGDGGQAILAPVCAPGGVAVDNAGNVYIADRGWHIRKVDPMGVITTIAGSTFSGYSGDGGPATSAQLNQPSGIATHTSGNIYIADLSNSAIRKIDPSGIITTIAGNGTPGYSGDGGPATAALLNAPMDVVADNFGNIFIADWTNHCVRKINPSGIITTIAGNGSKGYSGDGGPSVNAQLGYPSGLAVDNAGNIYISDWDNNRIRKINTSGIITTIAGNGIGGYSGDGGMATSAQINRPHGILIDPSGNIIFSEINNHIIRKINSSGIISTIAGSGIVGFSGDYGLATNAKLENPWGIAIDASSNVYLADVNNFRVRVVCQNSCLASTNDISQENSSFEIYPNPSTGNFKINVRTNTDNLDLVITNPLGQKVFTQQLTNSENNIFLSFESGIYFWQTIQKGQILATGKLILE